jgi:VWFA-related protein
LPLEEALLQARASGQLVLLHMRAGSNADQRAEEWLTAAWTHDAILHSIDGFVLARTEYTEPVIRHYEEIADVAKRREPHIVILDPAGGVAAELVAFKDFGAFASALSSMLAQAPKFAESARLRLEGDLAGAYFVRGIGLANAGAAKYGRRAFDFAEEAAKKKNDPVMAQRAQLGRIAIDVDTGRTGYDAVRAATGIAEHALAPDIGVDAWLLIGEKKRQQRDSRQAFEAFTNAYKLAPPGSPLAEAARRRLEAMGMPLPGAGTPSPLAGAVHLVFPRRTVLAGSLDVVATAPDGAARVEFLLDDARIDDSTRRPFRARLPLGATPRVHTIRAVAYDDHDRAMGEEAVTINDHVERLSVEITTPKSDDVDLKTEVEVTPRVPDGEVIDGVDVYWNETKLATLTAAPYRTHLELPSHHAFGYLRAVARTRSGASSEDAKLINPAALVDEARVDAVEVYAIVQDRSGKNVEGLKAGDFEVKEDGRPVQIALRGSANDPITVGIALDTSGSMRPAMMDVAEDARTFLRDSLTPGDRTMLVTFQSEPHLAQPLTSDLQHVSSQIFDAVPGGATAVWDAIAFSLTQLKSVEGKRALLVFTDGIDNNSAASPHGVRMLAHEAGVPVYVVLMFSNEGLRTSQLYLPNRERLATEYSQLAKESGGAVFINPKQTDLPRLFAQVRDDTRGEYILSFVSKSTRPRREPRSLKIDVPRQRVVIRAPTAYVSR